MSNFSDRVLAGRQASWNLLHRLGRLLHAPAVSVIGLPAADMPAPIDQWPAGLRVLVADDNPDNLMVASEMLEYFGLQSLLAADGAQAVAIAANNRLDLILMDLQMPVLDGLGATRQIRKSEQEQVRARVPVVAYTSVSGIRLQLSDFGMDGVLAKPCEMPTLRECLLRWCPPQGQVGKPLEAAAWLRH